jgi:cytoskeletal protein CcmA (bactofilin family)
VVVDGTIEGPIRGGEVILKSRAHVIGDIHHQSLSIENGASFEGRSVHTGGAKGSVTQPDEAAPQPTGQKP